jgi:hypothetical protein
MRNDAPGDREPGVGMPEVGKSGDGRMILPKLMSGNCFIFANYGESLS